MCTMLIHVHPAPQVNSIFSSQEGETMYMFHITLIKGNKVGDC